MQSRNGNPRILRWRGANTLRFEGDLHEQIVIKDKDKQNLMLDLVLHFYHEGQRALKNGIYLNDLINLEVRDRIARAKYLEEKDIEKIKDIKVELTKVIDDLIAEGGILNA